MITYHLKTKKIIDTCPNEKTGMPKRVIEIFAKRILEEFQKTQQNTLNGNSQIITETH